MIHDTVLEHSLLFGHVTGFPSTVVFMSFNESALIGLQ